MEIHGLPWCEDNMAETTKMRKRDYQKMLKSEADKGSDQARKKKAKTDLDLDLVDGQNNAESVHAVSDAEIYDRGEESGSDGHEYANEHGEILEEISGENHVDTNMDAPRWLTDLLKQQNEMMFEFENSRIG